VKVREVRQHDPPEREQPLRREQQFFPADGVAEMTGGEREEKERDHLDAADPAEAHGRMCLLINLPRNRHRLHLSADDREDEAHRVQAIDRDAQRGVGIVRGRLCRAIERVDRRNLVLDLIFGRRGGGGTGVVDGLENLRRRIVVARRWIRLVHKSPATRNGRGGHGMAVASKRRGG
jgi:hypothetical protein